MEVIKEMINTYYIPILIITILLILALIGYLANKVFKKERAPRIDHVSEEPIDKLEMGENVTINDFVNKSAINANKTNNIEENKIQG